MTSSTSSSDAPDPTRANDAGAAARPQVRRSPQAGCGMNYPFRATGQAGLTRNMSTAETADEFRPAIMSVVRSSVRTWRAERLSKRTSGRAAAALRQSAAALEALLDGPDSAPISSPDADPVRLLADACLDGLSEAARVESRVAALKVRLAAGYVHLAEVLAGPAATPQDCTAREMRTAAEVAGVLTVSERSASALMSDALVLTTSLPLTLDALQSGSVSWQHARIMVDEAAGLSPAGAGLLEAHFLDPNHSSPARGCYAGELVPGRFRAKARTWRERHHPVSIEARHTRGAADRRVEFHPDRDGMAWLNAYLPAVEAAGIFDRLTSASRGLQGPDEPRTLAQLRADVAAGLLLADHSGSSGDAAGPKLGEAASIHTMSRVPVPRAQVLVTVPVLSLLGIADEPAMLDGYGPTAVDGQEAGGRRRRFVPPCADRSPGRGALGNQPHELPDSEGDAALASDAGRQVHFPGLQ